MMHTELYCHTLQNLSREEAIRAIHQAYLQLKALNDHWDCGHYDNQPALQALADCLKQAGYIGG